MNLEESFLVTKGDMVIYLFRQITRKLQLAREGRLLKGHGSFQVFQDHPHKVCIAFHSTSNGQGSCPTHMESWGIAYAFTVLPKAALSASMISDMARTATSTVGGML